MTTWFWSKKKRDADPKRRRAGEPPPSEPPPSEPPPSEPPPSEPPATDPRPSSEGQQ